MDSFFESPRPAPEPISIEKFSFQPTVPEVSMISTMKTTVDNVSYENLWKNKHQQIGKHSSQQNCVPMGYKTLHAQFARKHVRFESPVLQVKPCSTDLLSNKKPNSGTNSSTFGEFSELRKQQLNALKANNTQNEFEKMYMANIPDRKLDLSLLYLPTASNNSDIIHCEKEIDELSDKSDQIEETETEKSTEDKENYMPKTYQDFLKLQKTLTASKQKEYNDSVTDIFNYKKVNKTSENECFKPFLQTDNRVTINSIQDRPQAYNYNPTNTNLNLAITKCDSETQTSIEEDNIHSNALQNKMDYEPTTSDLIKIIARQNEQLLLLQKQVAMLLERDKNYRKPIEGYMEGEHLIEQKKTNSASTPQKNHFRQENTIIQQAGIFQDNQRKWGMSKFSINLTTSFEMPLRTQQKQNFINHEPKIQEVTESDLSPKTDKEPSIHLQESIAVREPCPSPQPSININMNDYESSDEEELASEIGATFYNNLMGQVNNMLKKGKIETQKIKENENKTTKMLNKVREATLNHLKSVGITLGPINEDPTTSEHELSNNYTPTEISCAVKQLLTKYLPQDQLKTQKEKPVCEEVATTGLIRPRPEFSAASLEYMKKYNLIPSKEKVPDFFQPHKDNNRDTKRILDLTALKMQPKYL